MKTYTRKQTNKQTNKQTSKQTNKPTRKTNKQNRTAQFLGLPTAQLTVDNSTVKLSARPGTFWNLTVWRREPTVMLTVAVRSVRSCSVQWVHRMHHNTSPWISLNQLDVIHSWIKSPVPTQCSWWFEGNAADQSAYHANSITSVHRGST